MECTERNLDFLSLVIWSRVFWLSVTWNFRKAQQWSKTVLTFDRCAGRLLLQSQTKIVGTLKPNAVFFLLVLPFSLSNLFIAVQSPNLVHQHWGDRETQKCPNTFDWDCSCPRRDFAQKAKSRGGTIVTRACIKESTYSLNIQSVCQKKISICLNRGREESVGNDDVSFVCARKYEMVKMT